MLNAKVDGIAPRLDRQFVHERFDGKHVGMRPESAQRGHPQRLLRDEVPGDSLLRKRVKRDGVSVAAAVGLAHLIARRIGQRSGFLLGRQKIGSTRASGRPR